MRTRSGFTLLELIIYIGITAIVVVSLTNVMISVFETREKTRTVSEAQQVSRMVMDRIIAGVLDGTDVDVTDHVLTITTDDERTNPTVFTLQDSAVFLQQGSSSAYQLTPHTVTVSDLVFAEPVDRSVDASITVSGGSGDLMTLSTTITLRQ